VLGFSTLVTTCGDQGPTGPDSGLASAGFDLTGLARAGGSLPIPVDSLRVTLRRSRDNSIAIDTAIYINASAVRTNLDTIAITLRLALKETPEAFDFLVQARGGGIAYYEVNGNVSVSAGGITRTPDMAPTYVGPGAQADSVTMSLAPTAIAGGDSALVWARVWDGDTVVHGVPVGYRSSDTLKLNTIRYVGVDSAWVQAPLALTDSVDIIAVTPTGLTQSQRLSFAPPPTQLVIASGDAQTVPAGSPAGAPLVVELRDAAGNPYPIPREIVFAVVSGPGTVAPLQDTTDAAGHAQTLLTAGGSAGTVQVSATATGISGAAVTFSATVTGGGGPGAPDTVVVISGNNQTAVNGTQLPAPLVVEVRDQAGIPVPGVTVDWSPVQGSAVPTTGPTDASGRAQTNWTLGTSTANQSLTATVAGLTPQTFNATATFASPTILLSFTGVPGVGIGLSTNLNVGLSTPAGPGGVNVTVTSDLPGTVSVGGTGHVVIAQGQSSGVIAINGVSLGTTTIRGNATGFTEGTLSVDVQDRSISLPTTLNVPYGQTASLPIQLASPAPPGGVTFTVNSSNTNFVGVSAPTVFIAAGALTANVTLQGILPGPSTVTVSNPSYTNGVSAVTTTASLNIAQSSTSLDPSFGTTITISFQSNGSGIAAPAPGVAVTMTPANAACVVATSPVTIATGLVSTTSNLTYGGSATLPCTTYLQATAPNIQPDSVLVTVNPIPGITLNGFGVTVGSGLELNGSGSLATPNHGGATLTLTSSDPATLLLSPDASTPGTASINLAIPNGTQFFSYYTQGVEGQTGPATITASAPGFSNGTVGQTVVQPAVDLQGVPTTTTTLSPDNAIYARLGIPDGSNSFLIAIENVRPGAPGPVTATFTSNAPAVGTLVDTAGVAATRTAQVPVGLYYTPTSVASGGVGFRPLTTGSADVSVTVPGYIVMPAATRTVNVVQPGVTLNGFGVAVGSGLQLNASGSLGASNHGGVTLTLTSSDPSILLLSPDAVTPGTASINIPIANGSQFFGYYVQGVEGQTGTATITGTASGFSNGSVNETVAQPALDLQGVPATTTTLSTDNAIYARIGIPDGSNSFLVAVENVRAGAPGPLTATFVSSSPAVGTLVDTAGTAATRTAQIPIGLYYTPTAVAAGGVAFHPLTSGSTNVSVTAPGSIVMPSATRGVTVSQPGITLNGFSYPVGSGLQLNASGNLGAANHGGVTLTLTSSNPAVMLLSPDAVTPGTASINIPMANGTQFFGFYVQGVEGQTGTVSITASASGFSNGSVNETVEQAAMDLQGVPANTTTLSPDDAIYARVGVATGNSFLVAVENVRAGAPAPLTVTFASSTPSVGNLVNTGGSAPTRTAQIPSGLYYTPTSVATGGVGFHPILAGSTTVSATAPGVLVISAASRGVVISQPAITLNGFSYPVGAGLQLNASGNLGASNHGGVTVTLTSSNPGVLLLSPDATTAGTGSITINMANGSTFFGYYVQGVEGQTGTVNITATASGFTNGTTTETVVQPSLDLQGVPNTIGAGAADVAIYARVGIGDANNLFLNAVENVRAGGPGLTVTFTNANQSAATLVNTGGTGATRTALIVSGFYYTPTSVGTGGVAFRPVAAGTTSVVATAPGALSTAAATRPATVQ
jgi:hypothetical protein